MNIFIYVTGIASLLGLVLQLKDAFPKYRDLRKNILLVVLGTFIGSLLGGIRIVTVTLSMQKSLIEILALVVGIGLCTIIGILVTGLIFVRDSGRRESLLLASLIITGFFIVLMLSVGIIESETHKGINLDELKSLVDIHEKNKNYDRSIDLLERMKSKMRTNDIRLESINSRIESLKKKQLAEVNNEDN